MVIKHIMGGKGKTPPKKPQNNNKNKHHPNFCLWKKEKKRKKQITHEVFSNRMKKLCVEK